MPTMRSSLSTDLWSSALDSGSRLTNTLQIERAIWLMASLSPSHFGNGFRWLHAKNGQFYSPGKKGYTMIGAEKSCRRLVKGEQCRKGCREYGKKPKYGRVERKTGVDSF